MFNWIWAKQAGAIEQGRRGCSPRSREGEGAVWVALGRAAGMAGQAAEDGCVRQY